ncbi:MAG TPA: DNA primase catalytic subunit PriS [Candidatus Norongarragalinales archaeon]|jgi:DNA primase small subunit|nr:DNA primase catalytic subunit PriS [Candidatus Norongarragalinales archaeon]
MTTQENSFTTQDSFLGSPEHVFVLKGISQYYNKGVKPPSEVSRREFGFGHTKKIDLRHKSFASEDALLGYLRKELPLYISYSTAFYDLPEGRPMPKKGWRGAELVFDLDTPPAHEKHQPMLCEGCLEGVKRDALRLAEEFLEKDFGISKQEMDLNFSGSKGFHVHVHSKAFEELDTNARKKIADYILGTDVTPEKLFTRQGKILRGPSAKSKGWKKRVHSYAKTLIEQEGEKLKAAGARSPLAKMISENKQHVLKRLDEGNWDPIKNFEKLAHNIAKKAVQANAVPIDKPVTYDTARLIRLPDTIHGDTGFIAKRVPWSDAEKFDPLKHALAFSTTKMILVRTFVEGAVQFNDATFEIKNGSNIEVPEALAAFLLLKRKAKLVPATTS